mmetsp:Transcript_39465/g.111916  ORF Transcript_39465/g.111916 Transcript_39465/m.111916 type:complete len:247 (+) Transcript_39465:113-853(+)
MPVREAEAEVVQHVGLGDGQPPHPLCHASLQHVGGFLHIVFGRLDQAQRVRAHVPRKRVVLRRQDAALHEGLAVLEQPRILVLCERLIQEDQTRAPLHLAPHVDLGGARLEQQHLRGQEVFAVGLLQVDDAAHRGHPVRDAVEEGPAVGPRGVRGGEVLLAPAAAALLDDAGDVRPPGDTADLVLHARRTLLVAEDLGWPLVVRVFDERHAGVAAVHLAHGAASDDLEADLHVSRRRRHVDRDTEA